ncbi:ankyrin repeat domain-containing protein [Paenibacillus sp. FSL P2-0136]|uniref:ankyrin repeat domain-containing protein n=2 Tax=Paenibacillus sp. FSL P2-0136 TaxID=2975317 RepID=UPI0030DD3FEA
MVRLHLLSLLLAAVLVVSAGCSGSAGLMKENAEDNQLQEEVIIMNKQLIAAAERGDTAEVLRLLEAGADIQAQDESGRTAVVAAAYGNHAGTVEALIAQGADINIRDRMLNNVLLYAGASGYLNIVKMAVEAGADTTLTNRYGGTALIPAADRGHVEVVKYLLEHSDVDIDHINNLGWTALLEAVILGDGGERHQTIVKLLLTHGADPAIADREGITPLAHAQSQGYTEMAAMLETASRF